MAQDAWHHGQYGPEEHVFRWLGLLVSLLAMYSFGGFDALMRCIMAGMGQKDSYAVILPHAVVHMPVVCNDRCRELQSAENCGFSTVAALGKVVNIFVLVQTPIPMVLTVWQTMEIHQLLLYKVVDILVVLIVRVPQVVHIPVSRP